MKEQWLMPGATVPVDAETTEALVAEIKRLIGVVGETALKQQRPWVGLTDDDFRAMGLVSRPAALAAALEAKLKEKNA
jgi:hypothetical protein